MAFISTGYNPKKPMENRITDIGPRDYNEFYPPVIANNNGKWDHHEILEPACWFMLLIPEMKYTP